MRPVEALAAKLGPGPIHAVIDGGHYRNIADVLARADLAARSLFLEHRDPGIVAAGPFLVPLDARKLGRLLRIEGIDAACVFWGGDVAEPVLFRHLRSLNLTEIPRPTTRSRRPPTACCCGTGTRR